MENIFHKASLYLFIQVPVWLFHIKIKTEMYEVVYVKKKNLWINTLYILV